MKLKVDDLVVDMVRGKHPTVNNFTLTEDFFSSEKLTVTRAGLFVVLHAKEIGLEMLWDKGTRVYIMLDKKNRNKVVGLCGNFNGRTDDEFMTRAGTVESQPSAFGESWKLDDSCPNVIQDIPAETTEPCGTANGVSLFIEYKKLLNNLIIHTLDLDWFID